MGLEYDERGKYFTDIILKDVILANIQTKTNNIKGYVHIRKGDRLIDEMNRPNEFIAVTDAQVFSQDGEILYNVDFLVINRENIVWMIPIGERQIK